VVAPAVQIAPPLVQPFGYDTRRMAPAFAELLGQSQALVGLRRQLEQLVSRYSTARRMPPVLLLGETGTGKSLIARALHAEGPRANRPFVDINCAAIPETLMEAELFGFERGAFTDARQPKPGLFVAADRGTIFLDEIGLLPDNLQAKLLKVVEEQQVRPLGGTVSRPIDVWIIAATSQDLEAAIRRRRFREDLYHRLAVVTLRVPALRDRGEDVILLAEHLLGRACADYGLATKHLSRDALAALRAHRWPGNIRELSNVIERVALLSEAPSVTAGALGLAAPAREAPAWDEEAREVPAPAIDETVATVERDHLLAALAAAGGNVTRAARHLGLTRNTFRYRLRKHGVETLPSEPLATLPVTSTLPLPPVPSAAVRWERRRIACLRVRLVPPGEDAEHRQGAVLEEVRQKIVTFGGTIDGMSPDGMTAVFGLDLVEDGPRRAAHAAMAIRKLGERTRTLDAAAPTLKLALHGLHALLWQTSETTHVDMESRSQIWQTLDTLVGGAGNGDVLVSESITEALRTTFHLRAVGPEHDGACVLLDAERAAPWSLGPSAFVGRGSEMAMLQGRLEQARTVCSQVVGIAGDPGIGKSRLLFEFRRTLDGADVGHLSARSVSYGRDLPLLPIIELVRRAAAIDDGDGPDVIVGKLASPYLLRLLGITKGIEAIAHLSPEALHQRTVEAFREMVLAASRARPLILVIEDLHWVDRASEGYLSALVDALH
jgi:two-component system, NtrC family, response regulator AtoC